MVLVMDGLKPQKPMTNFWFSIIRVVLPKGKKKVMGFLSCLTGQQAQIIVILSCVPMNLIFLQGGKRVS